MTQALRYRSRWFGLGLLMLAAIMVLALWPLPEQPAVPPYSDKILHAIAFAFLMLWFVGLSARSNWLRVFLLLLAYGAVMEILQSLTAYRFMSVGDLLADVAGLVVGWVAGYSGLARWTLWLEARIG